MFDSWKIESLADSTCLCPAIETLISLFLISCIHYLKNQMPRGWKDKSEISTWVDVGSVAGRPKWREVEEHPLPSSLKEEPSTRFPEPTQIEINGPIDAHLNYEPLAEGPADSSFPTRRKGKVIYDLNGICQK